MSDSDISGSGELEVKIDGDGWKQHCDLGKTITRSFEAAIALENLSLADIGVTIVLSDDATLAQLNDQWRSKPKPTNILSFPAPEGEKTESGKNYLGDMILAYGVVASEAGEQGKALETHLCHLVIHGALHLLGFDHLEDDAARQMEELERTAMKTLNLPDPYLPTSAKQENIER